MDSLMDKYAAKLVAAGLAERGASLLGFMDDEISWNRRAPEQAVLAEVFGKLNINSLLFAPPREPYASILGFLGARRDGVALTPSDCETRTFLHDLPVSDVFGVESIVDALKARKCLLIPGRGIVTCGTVSPEQTFINFSSACFALFVKFFSDAHAHATRGGLSREWRQALDRVVERLSPAPSHRAALLNRPPESAEDVVAMMDEAGRRTVSMGLVDSFFGNISFCHEGVLYISQTSSSLDELPGCIDPCPLDGSSCAAVTASSELTAHREIVTRTGAKAVLHGHPKFSVVMSMVCDVEGCADRGNCFRRCSHEREVAGIPVVPGEVGTGRYGLCNTVPPAVERCGAALVYGHGLFTTGFEDFNEAFERMVAVENGCRQRCLDVF